MAIPPRNNKRKARSSPERQTQPPEPPRNADNVPSSSSSSAADNFFSPSTKPFLFPPGYKFVPKDEELILHYLKPFSQGNKFSLVNVPIHHVNIYESNPVQLSEKYDKGNEKEWFFISERTKIGKGRKYTKRVDNGGYWNASAVAKKINAGKDIVGHKTTLKYYVGKQPNGVKGDWLMHEYWCESSDDNNEDKLDHALCKIYLRPKAENKKKAEEEENEKLKKEEVVLKEEIEQMAFNRPDQTKPHDTVYQKPPLLPAQDQTQLPQQLPLPYNPNDFSEFVNVEQQPVIPEDDETFWTDFMSLLDGDEESNNYGLLEGFDTEGMLKHYTN